MMMKIYAIMFVLLVATTMSFQPYKGCSQTKGYEDMVYCARSLRLNSPFIPPIPQCCQNLKMDNMFCLCEAVIPIFAQNFDVNKLGLVNHACGDLLGPGFHCGIYTIPGSA
ncbi:hypothetical protein EUTSA_v10022046mg [Eutrema salsugineum]|uniref:Bifunctional inhibitor/plant lipid transfer protein/seed storage helical domain-containing protein n=1 Tax=Eutrema salsugineum TaxID=72664 RepID=V4LUD3_EUTSA|nr:hypothetical protein EUTSA_v10022046mg [Eutrema salsugineum]